MRLYTKDESFKYAHRVYDPVKMFGRHKLVCLDCPNIKKCFTLVTRYGDMYSTPRHVKVRCIGYKSIYYS